MGTKNREWRKKTGRKTEAQNAKSVKNFGNLKKKNGQ